MDFLFPGKLLRPQLRRGTACTLIHSRINEVRYVLPGEGNSEPVDVGEGGEGVGREI
jgi:hypothetical protein